MWKSQILIGFLATIFVESHSRKSPFSSLENQMKKSLNFLQDAWKAVRWTVDEQWSISWEAFTLENMPQGA